jgi:uncharacterized protein (TIGR02145 family)
MKNALNFFVFMLVIALSFSCKKEKPTLPSITTNTITEITTTTSTSGGNVTDDGGAPIITKGVCWNTSDNPTIVNNKTTESGGAASFISNISQLSPNTSYYVRAYATNSAGTGYGKSVSFKTLGDKPSSNVLNASNIQLYSATLNGSINPNSFSTIITFEYGVSTNYGSTIIAPQSPISGDSNNDVSTDLSGLTPGTTYHFRIKAENILGVTYSSDMTFITLGQVPSATAQPATNLLLTSAKINGSVNPNFLSTTITFEWGTSPSYGNTVSASQSPITGNTVVNISADLSGLAPGTTYHFRIIAVNGLGTTSSNDMTFITLGQAPTATAQTANDLQLYTATVNGSVNPNYLSTTVSFEWGISASYGNTVSASQSPITGNTVVNISADLSGLAPGTTYHFRIKAENILGITYSSDMTFITLGQAPTATAQTANDLQLYTATVNGSVNPNYLSTTVSFEWGTSTSYGNTVAASQSPITGNTAINTSADLSGLAPGTTYHFRIKAENILGITYSSDLTFTTLTPITDIDGNVYGVLTIGSQVWMTENLKTTKYNNGDIIGTTTPALLDISGELTPKYQWPCDGNESNVAIYGRLYTWFTATDPRNICPTGWRIPTDYEWTALTNYLENNGYGYGGSGTHIAKSMAATSHWIADPTLGVPGNDQTSNNASGFNGIPGGVRSSYTGGVDFSSLGGSTAWWSSTELEANIAWQRILVFNNNDVLRSYFGGKKNGIAVRCIKK